MFVPQDSVTQVCFKSHELMGGTCQGIPGRALCLQILQICANDKQMSTLGIVCRLTSAGCMSIFQPAARSTIDISSSQSVSKRSYARISFDTAPFHCRKAMADFCLCHLYVGPT